MKTCLTVTILTHFFYPYVNNITRYCKFCLVYSAQLSTRIETLNNYFSIYTYTSIPCFNISNVDFLNFMYQIEYKTILNLFLIIYEINMHTDLDFKFFLHSPTFVHFMIILLIEWHFFCSYIEWQWFGNIKMHLFLQYITSWIVSLSSDTEMGLMKADFSTYLKFKHQYDIFCIYVLNDDDLTEWNLPVLAVYHLLNSKL